MLVPGYAARPSLPADSDVEVMVYVMGTLQCAGATYGEVSFTVQDGAAAIDTSNP